MIVYKVVRVVDDEYHSLYGFKFPKYDLQYKIGEITRAKVGYIFAYKNRETAIKASEICMIPCPVVLKSKAEEAYEPSWHIISVLHIDCVQHWAKAWWSGEFPITSLTRPATIQIPINTLLCTDITPLELIN